VGIGGILMGRACLDLELAMNGAVYPDRRVAVMTHRPVDNLPANARCFAGDLAEPLAWLREREGDVWLYGGGQLAGQALAAGVIDEIHTAVVPVSLGAGIALFGGAPSVPRSWAFDSVTRSASGYVMLTYRKV